ncbi:probable receptor-like serine/threonine-protein kinase At5g57670 isoform X2 [Euphorbia lathyris]|uniref:probable receptor-like serine/threonine-protein kinase At5g57670 isoform X2 n=1 Tax=Euphorbia lathyris TaxID=212925 RepID=UPI003313CCB8
MRSCAKILVGISLDPLQSKELISWAITVLAHPNDHIVAIHFLNTAKHSHIRLAKAHVISVLADFATISQIKHINLEARVGFSSTFAKGLVQEANSISADYLILRWNEAIRYCLKHAPESCTVISIGKYEKPPQDLDSPTLKVIAETNLSNSKWLCKSSNDKSNNSAKTDTISTNKIQRNVSSRSVLYEESQSTEENDSISIEGSSNSTEYSPHSLIKTESKSRYQIPGCKLISSIFASPLRRRKESFSSKENQPVMNSFSYAEIANATNNFHPDNMVGRGGYSEVYRGDLSDGRIIAVKRLAKDNKDCVKERDFLIELGIIGHVSHPNTATLVGYCIENGLYLLFTFSQNGTLASALHGKRSKPLEWEERYKIALGVGRGLHYLHKCCKHRIIHRDIKASNVLLGPHFHPQITDFGLAKWLPNKWTHHAVIPIEGTFGYLAPEYFMHGIVDEKTDVFSFGILLLEIISGRRPVDSSKPTQNLLSWAKPLMESGKIREVADPKLRGIFDEDEMHKLALTASFCVRQSSIWRPSMTEVLELLINGEDSEVARSWRMPKFTSDDLDDYSMVFGYDVPLDHIDLHDYL